MAFQLLYGRLVLFHEAAGGALWGEAWRVRRTYCIDAVPGARNYLDLGAGEGFVVLEAQKRFLNILGIEPSQAMRASAWRRGVYLVDGTSSALPLASASIDAFLITYPGTWILHDATWRELERVGSYRASVAILMGGSYSSGPRVSVRRFLSRASYGKSAVSGFQVDAAVRAGFAVHQRTITDKWGEALMLFAERVRD